MLQTEVHSNKGRCDILVKTAQYIYVMELKRDGKAAEALDQIISTNYYPMLLTRVKKLL